MSYQVLARKWRPGSFEDMVGQSHVVRALSNALDRGQLHHAYLLTGTRGVGKTTLARILSKALNCEQGVSSKPCGECSSCREIDEGRFVDLLEVDAASRTKVDQTRELLDNVPFAPVKGRFKVYLIDEVHMFSTHSFNALLKTLEEPPPHVKFLLATTDPQKVPVTVLSRCLQFNLKRLVPEEIRDRLARILQAEGVESEPQALALLARAADGSMRDGLSLLDQAIAFGGGRVGADDVRTMLGTVGRDLCLSLLQALARLDGAGLLDEVAGIAELTPDFAAVLQEIIGLLHRIALHQQVPATLSEDDPDREQIQELSGRLPPEDVQLFYQIALMGQQDLPLAPDPRAGIEMVLLRMLAYRPDGGDGTGRDPLQKERKPRPSAPAREVPASRGESRAAAPASPAAAALAAARRSTSPGSPANKPPVPASARSLPDPPRYNRIGEPEPEDPAAPPVVEAVAEVGVYHTAAQSQAIGVPGLNSSEDWHRLVGGLGLGGMASQLARNCELVGWDGRKLSLTLDPECRNVHVPATEEGLRVALAKAMGVELKLDIRVSNPERETPARRHARNRAERQSGAEVLMEEDPTAQFLRDELDARWVPDSIEPMD
jgi:DNA polymerase III subunit gamma/tau